jgi:hypothetical protein
MDNKMNKLLERVKKELKEEKVKYADRTKQREEDPELDCDHEFMDSYIAQEGYIVALEEMIKWIRYYGR